jgi:CRISPR-associated endonuclease/helicase Cas3
VKIWRWFVRKPESPNERSRMAVTLECHISQAKDIARRMVEQLGLPQDIADAVVLATEFHDQGKNRERWQHSIGNDRYPDQLFAKSGRLPECGKLRPRAFIDNYRHEFGSLLDIEKNPEFCAQSEDMKDLIQHLIAAHHGYARPHFPPENAYDLIFPAAETDLVATAVPRRFARLQRKYGRWGLAYLESLVRAADWAASAGPAALYKEAEVKA